MTRPDVSVIVLVHGRHEHLRRTLASLADTAPPPAEVVVVAMADPEVHGLVAATPAPFPVRVVELDADPRCLPLARARNTGARRARGGHLVFLDVDCLADPGLLGAYDAALHRLRPTTSGRPVVVAGPVSYLPEGWERTGLSAGQQQLDWDGLHTLRNPHAARPDPGAGQLVPEDRFELFWSLSFAVTADDFRRIGGFDEAYRGYGGEDTDFARRLQRAGGSLWWVGGADAYHQYHPVSKPPVEHLDDILRNTALFQQRWGQVCMEGWLEAFRELGLASPGPDGTWRRTTPASPRPGHAPRPGATDSGCGGVLHVVPGPASHGITRHALQLLEQGGAPYLRVATGDEPSQPEETTPPDGRAAIVDRIVGEADGRGVHLHLNDDSLGAATVQVVEELAGRLLVSLTLHDLPDPREGEARYDRRARAYARLWRSSVGVVLASQHELRLLEAAARHAGQDPAGLSPVRVVPLPLTAPGRFVPAPDAAGLEPVVAVLGYLYPGKGHEQAVDLAAALGLRGVVALGTTSPGHKPLADQLRERARALGLDFELTGFLPDDDLLARARRVALPLAWHAHASASGSIGSWLQAGRRPLVADGGWVRELDARCPGSVTVVADEEHLAAAGRAALADPTTTFLAPGTRLEPTLAQAWQATDRAVRAAHHRHPCRQERHDDQ